MAQQWYWCTRHDRVEHKRQCPATFQFGPYDSPEEARRYAERAEARNERWEEEDKRWEGDDDRA